VRQLTQNFQQSARKRFDDAARDTSQQDQQRQAQQQEKRENPLQQAAAELRRNYRERYDRDFTSVDARQVFDSGFFRMADADADARTVSGRVEGDAGKKLVAASGDVAVQGAQTVIVPESHGLAEVRLTVVREGDQAKLSVPDALTPQALQQNLERQVKQANQTKAQWPVEPNDAQRMFAHQVFLTLTNREANTSNERGRTTPGGAR
jgi:hypothetical protein